MEITARSGSVLERPQQIAGCDNVADMIGQVLSAITLEFTPGNGEKIVISGLARRRLDGRRVVKERIREGKTVKFLL
jgi:hypothetical protein